MATNNNKLSADLNNDDELIAAIAQDYYIGQIAVTDLIKKYQLSRYLITKALKSARDTGIVKISIASRFERNFGVEEQIKQLFGVNNIYVLRDPLEPFTLRKQLSQFAAKQAQGLINQAKIVGLSWGDTIYELLDCFDSHVRNDLCFTQFMGEYMRYHSLSGSMRLVQFAAARYNCHYRTMPGSVYIINDAVRAGYEQEPAIVETLNVAHRMDMLITSISGVSSLYSIPIWKKHTKEIFPGVDLSKVAGFIFGRPYDINGNFLNVGSDKTLGLPVSTLLAVKRRFGVIKDKQKVTPALGALRGHFFTDLVLSEGVAVRILNAYKEQIKQEN